MIDPYKIVCLSAHDSGLGIDIWLHSSEVGIQQQGKPNILVCHQNEWKKIFVDSSTNISSELLYWINTNTTLLVTHWNGKISGREILNMLSSNKGDR